MAARPALIRATSAWFLESWRAVVAIRADPLVEERGTFNAKDTAGFGMARRMPPERPKKKLALLPP